MSNLGTKFMFDYIKGDYEKMRKLSLANWKSYLADCMGNIDLLWQNFHDKFKAALKVCVTAKEVRSGKIKRPHVLDKTSLKKRKERYYLWKILP